MTIQSSPPWKGKLHKHQDYKAKIETAIHFVIIVSLYFPTLAVNKREVGWQHGCIHQQQVLSIEEKVKKVIREIEKKT
jgi:hypothetical protein